MQVTERLVKSLKPPEAGNVIHYDGEVPGFGVRITAQSAVSFILTYYIAGRQRRYTIGRFPEWSATAARAEAIETRQKIRANIDPLEEREQQRGAPTVNDLAQDYMERAHATKRPSSIRNDLQMLANHILPRLGRLRVSAVGRRDVELLHGSLKKTPYRANRVLALLSTMFSFAIDRAMRTDNPVYGVKRYHEESREYWLSIEQLRELEKALAEYSDQVAANAIRLLIVTGAREGEALKADWSQFDLRRGIWTKPSHHTKQQKIERVPLNAAAMHILTELKTSSNGSNYLFPGHNGCRVTIRRPWVQVLKAAGLTQVVKKIGKRGTALAIHRPLVRIHDLRHTFASHLVSSGESLHKVGKLLGHTSPQTTNRYAHVDNKALRETADVFGRVYKGLLN